jgi:hypothetical protein
MSFIDEVSVWCWESYLDAKEQDLLNGNFLAENFVQNILYNMGFQITAILDLVFIDNKLQKEEFWFYVFSRVGDFLIRFLFRDEDPYYYL